METKTLRVQDREWRYHSSGKGTLVLIMLPGSLGVSRETASIICNTLPGLRMIIPEYSSAQKLSEMLDALDAILQQEQISLFSLYGSSFGGLIAQEWARRHTESISHLILCGTSTPNPKRIASHLRALKVLKLVPLWMIHSALRLFAYIDSIELLWKSEYKQLIARLTKKDLESRYQIGIDMDGTARYSANDLPDSIRILILEGNEKNPDQIKLLYPQAEIRRYPYSTHSMMITHTIEWAEVISKFLEFYK